MKIHDIEIIREKLRLVKSRLILRAFNLDQRQRLAEALNSVAGQDLEPITVYLRVAYAWEHSCWERFREPRPRELGVLLRLISSERRGIDQVLKYNEAEVQQIAHLRATGRYTEYQ